MNSKLLRKFPIFQILKSHLDNQNIRDRWVRNQLAALRTGALLLDAGSGSQRYRSDCSQLLYHAQDFGQYRSETKETLVANQYEKLPEYTYGELDYVSNIWEIPEKDSFFDVILCTEVFEHIPFPIQTLHEFSRLLKSGGKLILTAPSNCLRHQDPYYFYSGFSDRWYEYILPSTGFEIQSIEPVGDYYSWMSVEIMRTIQSHKIMSAILLFPAFMYYLLKKKNHKSINTLCMGYHVLAIKK